MSIISSDFDAMSVEKKQCQNEETVDECSARLLQERAEEECVPWSLKMTIDRH